MLPRVDGALEVPLEPWTDAGAYSYLSSAPRLGVGGGGPQAAQGGGVRRACVEWGHAAWVLVGWWLRWGGVCVGLSL
jgi:hypothetical protein